jgi:hypothetical protein
MSVEPQRKVGRPKGHVLSKESKDKIGRSKTGFRHTTETKDRISASVLRYYDKLNPLSDEMFKYYTKINAGYEVLKFLAENKEEIDSFDDVKTERKLRSMQYYECELWDATSVGDTITPQLLLLLKEEIEGGK